MNNFVLLMIEVPHNKSDMISQAANEAGCEGGTVLIGRKISSNKVAVAFGLGSTTIEIIYILTNQGKKDGIISAIKEKALKEKFNFGAIYELKADGLMKTGKYLEGEKTMANKNPQEMITVILNRGYADDAMQAARKAGAGGGTVVIAGGTANEKDEKFFGMHFVPEKEMLMIVVDSDKKDAVLEAIRTLPCLSEPGSGIAFTSAVNDVTLLGKN